MPDRPWSVFMRWHDLLFMHWPLRPEALRPLVPAALQLDTFDGAAWIGVVPFRMSGIRHRWIPQVPGFSAFAELNVRTYVTCDDKPGVWFFSLDAASRVAVRVARRTFHLPYFDAGMSCRPDGDEIHYRSRRTHRGAPRCAFVGRYRPTGPPRAAVEGSIDSFLTDRLCLYAADQRGRVYRGDIAHSRWRLQAAEAEIQTNTMVEPLGLTLPPGRPLLHFSRRLDVEAWMPQRVR